MSLIFTVADFKNTSDFKLRISYFAKFADKSPCASAGITKSTVRMTDYNFKRFFVCSESFTIADFKFGGICLEMIPSLSGKV